MASAQSDFLKVMINDVTFHWPRLDQPYRYNSQEKRSEACAATVTGAGYSIAWDMPTAEAKELHGELKKHYNATKARNAKLPDFSQIFGMKKDDAAGTVRFTAKKRAVKNDGGLNKPPTVVDGELHPLEDKAIWSGSKGSLRVLAFAATDPDGNGGISLLLDVVQVVEAVYGGDGIEDDFSPVKSTKPIADTDFGDDDDTPKKAAPRPSADAEF